MAHQLRFQSGLSDTEVIHQIVQRALRSAATASTASSAIDVLGDALLGLERRIANTSVLMHRSVSVREQTTFALSRATDAVGVKTGGILGLNA